ncbi:TPA: substrate-binding domain-containing protein [Vibrio parahaemolyticus]|uniref:substrate-binding domain-containing protein n=1 Tax=Vibrio harveyi group TaxID=717610 RepID=UPI001B81445D|nr:MULTISPECIES: substrate-binding domain-containing protein [Vibrio harveyi group]EJE4203778.1 substrate-binding domain-containing protein [Vibrio parahaemolyticus]ELB2778366.1 substrate-binding domain-containing protein [Vibrio parahaemolyticus]MCG6221708.1 substrate-binding domain-containing protein [Vibrio diabolicus]MCR9881961.1 substrate-binding domain-containing protein [Vibrio parahaemolyticus]MCR9896633.1 substrate-binding domain-containing protein [Vibrio parahaemolyticus]
MATIKDVAKEAGVSVATVSRVINKSPKASQASIDSVTKAMSKLGYRPNAAARALVSQSTNTMGVLVGDVSDPFFGTMIKSVDCVAHKNGKHLLIGNGYHSAEDERRALELLINSRCDAMVIHAKALSDEELIGYANEVKGMVLINRHIQQLAGRCVSLDNEKGALIATEYLMRNGHKKIAHIASSHDIEDTHQRLQGYHAALNAHGIELPKSYIEYGEPNSDGGEVAMTHLLTKSLDFTGVFAYNDYMAAGALAVLEENGIRVPEDIALVGFDDGLIARFVHPGLTTIRYPIEMMAERAAKLALALAHDEKIEEETAIFSPTLVRRYSV